MNRFLAFGLVSAGSGMLVGCSVLPAPNRMGEAGAAPGSWSNQRQGKAGIDDRWVDRLGGRSLHRLVAEAYGANPDLKASAARVDRAVAAARGAGAAARPQLNAALQGNRQKQNFIGLPISGTGSSGVLSSISESYGASLSLSWEIDLWGKVRAGEQAALADLQAQGELYRAARASLAAQVSRAWLALAESNEQIVLAEQAVKIRKDNAELIFGRFQTADSDTGASGSQVRLAQTDVATAEATLQQRKGEADQARRQLEILLGRYPSAELSGSAKLPEVPAHPPAGLPSELLMRRPDLLAAERQLAAAGKRRTEAKLAYYPSFPLTASAGTTTNELRNIFDSDFGVWSLGGRLAQPILAGGQLRAQEEIRTAEEKEALANLQQVVLNAFGEVEMALAADQFLAEREGSVGEALKLAIEGADSAQQDFAGGAGDVLTLLQAQSRRIELASQHLTLRRLRLDNRVTLHLALGGDYRL
ncbi:NodT family efflux transporter outer membrane factor (OMF) lipoprotein [Haloferula luteola]|uniref:NodT family efflux transporter outer membrane factor (OMF) lipoprotein n=1 Tax=Haloferula luteola TaxID=595692 RepID=A0A840VGM1_9BACT|nr:efflux transporter outer membrane subunit [Haloferula luteola]MBB5352980.1 NodT family efflux transporter outer membrane factor (OMF) lipoprotein [Haloferula luteola]